ncbi:MAG: SH3 domain-containing protein [Eubacteriales bacterium]|nr:SH3 domain-containing protein [Eubacteriales bacterium]
MKRKFVQFLCGVAAMSTVLGGSAVFAEEKAAETETASEVEAETETEDSEAETETAETEKAADVEVSEEGEALWTAENLTGIEFSKAEMQDAALVLTDEEGTEHQILDVDPEDVDAPVLKMFGSFVALEYLSKESGETARLVEEGEEVVFDEAKTMYVVDDVYVRAEASAEAEAVSVAGRGSEIQVLGELPKWYRMELGDGEGFISKSYVTEMEDVAAQAVEAEAQARAQIAAQAAAEAQAAAAAQAAAGQNQAPAQQGRYEVSRQKYDDCDGSGHGYYEITYSDGTVETEEY